MSLLLIARMQATAQTDPQEIQSTEEAADHHWSYDASSYIYIVPDDQNYASGTFMADKDWLHLEARYNYEDLETGSFWIGYNFETGENWVFAATPMFGGIVGNTAGVAPGWKLSLSYKMLELYSENEYVFDLRDSSGNFYYNWSEATLSPVEWFRFGLVVQRTKAYHTDLDVQRGLLLGFSYKSLDLGAYVFNLGWEDPTYVFSAAVHF